MCNQHSSSLNFPVGATTFSSKCGSSIWSMLTWSMVLQQSTNTPTGCVSCRDSFRSFSSCSRGDKPSSWTGDNEDRFNQKLNLLLCFSVSEIYGVSNTLIMESRGQISTKKDQPLAELLWLIQQNGCPNVLQLGPQLTKKEKIKE